MRVLWERGEDRIVEGCPPTWCAKGVGFDMPGDGVRGGEGEEGGDVATRWVWIRV